MEWTAGISKGNAIIWGQLQAIELSSQSIYTLYLANLKINNEVKPSFIAANKELTEISLEGPEKVILEDLMAIPEEWDVTHTLFSEETYDLLVLLDY